MEWAAHKTKTTLVEVDIEADDALLAAYGMRIPVVLTEDGVVLAEGEISDRRLLRKRIRAVFGD